MFPYQDPSQPVETRISDLLGRMTVEEKIGQCIQSFGGEFKTEAEYLAAIRAGGIGSRIMCGSPWAGNAGFEGIELEECERHQRIAVEESRLGIPIINGRDIIHGHRTMAPIPLAQAASFDPEEVKNSAAIAACEASAECVHWTFAPMMDLCRDPRWGRSVEGFGEDPYLGEEMAVAMVEGFQGDDMSDPRHLASCAKHFAGYGFAEGGRDYDASEISKYSLFNLVLRPFRAAVERAKVSTLMTSFQVNDGTPSSSSDFLMRDVLRKMWGFDGFVVSDWGAIEQVEFHGAAQDEKDAAKRCFKAGTTMEMVGNLYPKYLKQLIDEGSVTMAELDEAAASVLRIKFRAGLFEHPYTDVAARKSDIFKPEHIAAVRKQAANCMVLAKNNGILPLSGLSGKRVALVGPFVNEKLSLMGTWTISGRASETPSFAEAFKEAAAEFGFKLVIPDSEQLDKHLTVARRDADIIIACVGEHAHYTGEGHAAAKLGLPYGQESFIEDLKISGKPLVVLCANGRVFPVNAAERCADALLYTWHAGTETARAAADVVFGKADPSGRFPMSVPRSAGQIPIYYNRKFPGKIYSCAHNSENDADYPLYDDEFSSPLHPFGYGLSYTTFELRDVKLAHQKIKKGESNKISATLVNTGSRRGKTVVQCYVRDPRATFSRPIRELAGFQKIEIESGESRNVEFTLDERVLGYYGCDGERLLESGEFRAGLGFDATTELKHSFFME